MGIFLIFRIKLCLPQLRKSNQLIKRLILKRGVVLCYLESPDGEILAVLLAGD